MTFLSIVRMLLLFWGQEGIAGFWKQVSQELICVSYDQLICSEWIKHAQNIFPSETLTFSASPSVSPISTQNHSHLHLKTIMTNSCQFCLQNALASAFSTHSHYLNPTATVSNSSLRLPSFCSPLKLYTYTVRAIILAELIIHRCALYLCCPFLPLPNKVQILPGEIQALPQSDSNPQQIISHYYSELTLPSCLISFQNPLCTFLPIPLLSMSLFPVSSVLSTFPSAPPRNPNHTSNHSNQHLLHPQTAGIVLISSVLP